MSYSHEESIEEILTNYESAHDELADNDRNFWLMVTEVASANLSVTLDPRLTNRIDEVIFDNAENARMMAFLVQHLEVPEEDIVVDLVDDCLTVWYETHRKSDCGCDLPEES